MTDVPQIIRASSGTLTALGLGGSRCEVLPTTAYLLTPGGCCRDCAFCAQGAGSSAGRDRLSRVVWPQVNFETLVSALVKRGWRSGIRRVCLQVTGRPDAAEWVESLLVALRERTQDAKGHDDDDDEERFTVSLSWLPWGSGGYGGVERAIGCLGRAFALGAERVGVSLDAATPRVYAATKTPPLPHQTLGSGPPGEGANLDARPSTCPSWEEADELLQRAAELFPGRVSSHLIVGLGETEGEALERLSALIARGVTVALFAFTPVKGTRLASFPRPDLARYRRIQLAAFVMRTCGLTWQALDLSAGAGSCAGLRAHGRVVWDGHNGRELLLRAVGTADLGDAFRTSGCPWCNRPYYNEVPGGDIYNYPRPLTAGELADALTLAGVQSSLAAELAQRCSRWHRD